MACNRLSREKSPYLLQHQHNPVDWYPWGEEAISKAVKEDKPIFLSIGYSTCHWCHVMERESFEQQEIGDLLNNDFVSIKVDREERPDIDRQYMLNQLYVQATTGSGGWPLSLFLTPKLLPFFGATYIPPSTLQQPGFKELLNLIANKWKSNRNDLIKSSEAVANALTSKLSQDDQGGDEVSVEELLNGCNHYKKVFDPINGGFGSSPKFPNAPIFHYLFCVYEISGVWKGNLPITDCLEMAIFTLKKMSFGGIYDHIEGGFHRYTTDVEFHVPHFEKMIYDQSQLMYLYSIAYGHTKDERFLQVVYGTLDYLTSNMLSPKGGFYSALDADSVDENVKREGAYYTMTFEESMSINDHELICYTFGIQPQGNVHPTLDIHGELKNQNVLKRREISDVAEHFHITVEEATTRTTNAINLIKKLRATRQKPHLDDKIIASWNGLMISALCKAFLVFQDKKFLEIATQAATFIQGNMTNGSKLYRSYLQTIDGFAEDYACCIQDKENGGYFNASNQIYLTFKDSSDNSEPSANSVIHYNLLRLNDLCYDKGFYKEKLDHLTRTFAGKLKNNPEAFPFMSHSVLLSKIGTRRLTVYGMKSSIEYIQRNMKMRDVVVCINDDEAVEWFQPGMSGISDRLELCEFHTCTTLSLDELKDKWK